MMAFAGRYFLYHGSEMSALGAITRSRSTCQMKNNACKLLGVNAVVAWVYESWLNGIRSHLTLKDHQLQGLRTNYGFKLQEIETSVAIQEPATE